MHAVVVRSALDDFAWTTDALKETVIPRASRRRRVRHGQWVKLDGPRYL